MKKTPLILCGNAIFLIIIMIFVWYEMDQNRKQLTKDLAQAMNDPQGKITRDTLSQIGLGPTNAAPDNGTPPVRGNDTLGSLLDVAAGTIQQAEKTVTGNNTGMTNTAAGQPTTNDAVNTLLNLAADTERRVNQIGLRATELTDDEETEFGRQLDAEILKEMPEDPDPAGKARLETLAKDLVSQCQRKQIQYHFKVLTAKTVNAFCVAGGYVYVTSAYLKEFPSDAELAMTLGHEIAHVELKHAVHKVQYAYHGQKVFGGGFSIAQTGYAVLSSPFTKEQEFDADAWGFAACKKVGWDSGKLLALFDNLEKYEQEHQSTESEPASEFERHMGRYFDPHPPTADRLARLKGM